jgi:hypothetical protein|tara:strand:+ start:749 stop:922 length:174 start_codon:yes stop_codon:yes gene_type:complete
MKQKRKNVLIGLSVPDEINKWIEMEVGKNPFCDNRQQFILGTLRKMYREEVEETKEG